MLTHSADCGRWAGLVTLCHGGAVQLAMWLQPAQTVQSGSVLLAAGGTLAAGRPYDPASILQKVCKVTLFFAEKLCFS
jgi:hypothetical protein